MPTQNDDIQKLVDTVDDIASAYLRSARDHVARTMKKATLNILCEFSYNRQGELEIKIVPKTNFPEDPELFNGEISGEGSLRVW
ncbi:MAG: hypothetical protein GY861_22590 [bacterium]|nr:hypothetical protein [bacterium]